MAKIYPDTNRFVDFYRAALDSIDVFDELKKYRNNLVLTEQTVAEFRRNRVATLKGLATQFKKTIEIGSPYTTTLLRSLPGHKEVTELFASCKQKGQEVLRYLEKLIGDEQEDPVAQKFLALVADPAVTTLPLSDRAIALAHRRKLLGNPPCSPDKYSVGDEVIWELLLGNLKEDLIIVTRDNAFQDNRSLLSEEYQQNTGRRLLLVTEKFSEALKAIGQVPTEELIKVEKEEESRRRIDFPRDPELASMSVPELIELLSSPNESIRFRAARDLANRYEQPEVVWPALQAARSDSYWAVRIQVPRAAMHLGVPPQQAIPVLKALLDDQDDAVRGYAATALEHFGQGKRADILAEHGRQGYRKLQQ